MEWVLEKIMHGTVDGYEAEAADFCWQTPDPNQQKLIHESGLRTFAGQLPHNSLSVRFRVGLG